MRKFFSVFLRRRVLIVLAMFFLIQAASPFQGFANEGQGEVISKTSLASPMRIPITKMTKNNKKT